VLDDERGGPFLGLALVVADTPRAGGATIYAMWVAPAARGRMHATFLCEMCCRWAVERGQDALRLAVFAENARARRAYANMGFSVEDTAAIHTADGRAFEELRLVRAIGLDDGIV
jgi:ribosomal protein S18 acetylase RimI-like enzyme